MTSKQKRAVRDLAKNHSAEWIADKLSLPLAEVRAAIGVAKPTKPKPKRKPAPAKPKPKPKPAAPRSLYWSPSTATPVRRRPSDHEVYMRDVHGIRSGASGCTVSVGSTVIGSGGWRDRQRID